ncbi:hypothetical protein GCM10022220_29340 [Actinocatenispora rupis]|uniref:Uncharacterized protein n=1 Tax=Actinocatenispora rupis TaxID=519421 RepID=A0A8J3J6V1_9ACTN|nr:hypothetical protein Aru02nite_39940 [Actinocatenispora rupis]
MVAAAGVLSAAGVPAAGSTSGWAHTPGETSTATAARDTGDEYGVVGFGWWTDPGVTAVVSHRDPSNSHGACCATKTFAVEKPLHVRRAGRTRSAGTTAARRGARCPDRSVVSGRDMPSSRTRPDG